MIDSELGTEDTGSLIDVSKKNSESNTNDEVHIEYKTGTSNDMYNSENDGTWKVVEKKNDSNVVGKTAIFGKTCSKYLRLFILV